MELTPDASTATLERRAHTPRVSSIAGGDDHERRAPGGASVGAAWRAATQRFSTCGLSGARVDAIATAADSNERMLYYYFQSKGGLYVAVLETMYAEFARHGVSLDLAGLQPAAAIRTLALSSGITSGRIRGG
ncbi:MULTISPECIES: TetR family transcriptional regulator [unclassified Caballeronia]|uniref:TetR/AcrR family transcriptional regulator n=1 Tax=unclassified Caballeronia TaxID=2646786 RepID=UPI00285E77F4|nr:MULTISPECIES: TetR family transcriptional regulator [unclassified Caballeronia]MDR5752363.1 TetR family transcriptional regulator [Caballeronia sp. LZ024]MDR5845168.1 TetR family transcriptional regulator [Caballeronia sp. LZ031]